MARVTACLWTCRAVSPALLGIRPISLHGLCVIELEVYSRAPLRILTLLEAMLAIMQCRKCNIVIDMPASGGLGLLLLWEQGTCLACVNIGIMT